MSDFSILQVEFEIKWNKKQDELKKVFDTCKKICSRTTSNIDLFFSLVEDNGCDPGIVKVSIYNDYKKIGILYREPVWKKETSVQPIWSHTGFIYAITECLKEINPSMISDNTVMGRCNISIDGKFTILDECGIEIKSPFPADSSFIPFDNDREKLDKSVIKILQNHLDKFKK